MSIQVIKEKGFTDVPVYMRNYTEEKEYSYKLSYRGFNAFLLKLNKKWWIVSREKWVVMGKPSKKEAEKELVQFVDKNYDRLKDMRYID